ncbi:MAG: type II secretion system protein N [Pseudomonadota bacterium]
MGKAIALGVLIFLVVIIARAPASLITTALPDQARAQLVNLDGTLWGGAGDLLVEGVAIGRLDWALQPVTFLKGRVGYDLALSGGELTLDGEASAGITGTTEAALRGQVGAGFVNQWLAPYYINLAGTFRIDDLTTTITGSGPLPEQLGGQIRWDGGPVNYRLSGKMHSSALPPMRAELGPGPEAVAFAEGETTPLLIAELKSDGFARIGVTKYLTRLLGQPWPGGDPDHAVVLEVEEQVF